MIASVIHLFIHLAPHTTKCNCHTCINIRESSNTQCRSLKFHSFHESLKNSFMQIGNNLRCA
uniref:Uncharacterized protein n=1 Tax=Rhizophora mucronata TaxID=61149 RepID=A0A2P2QP01_RHIMU